jgi:hypothetical protein
MFEEGQVVKSKKYGVCRIKKIVGVSCTVVTVKFVYGSKVHIVKLGTLSRATLDEVAEFKAQEEKADE